MLVHIDRKSWNYLLCDYLESDKKSKIDLQREFCITTVLTLWEGYDGT